MNSSSIFKKSALAIAVLGLLASASAQADSLMIDQDINSLAFKVDFGGTTNEVLAGPLTVTNTTPTPDTSFLAFCMELVQGINVGTLFAPGLSFTAGGISGDVQTLFNQSYASLDLGSYSQLAGFQIALWETLDDNNLSAGSYQGWSGAGGTATNQADQAAALLFAGTLLGKVVNGDPATANYQLTTWSNAVSQDLIQANRVAEPATALLGALGLAGIAAVRRRKA